MDDGYYAAHLSAINANHNTTKAMLAEDILNARGAIVAKKNTLVDARVVKSLAKHKLTKPLDKTLMLNNGLNQRILLQKIEKMMFTANISSSTSANEIWLSLKTAIKGYSLSSLAMQKLTVLYLRFPEVFNNDLLTAITAVGIAHELGLYSQQKNNIVYACLLENMGYLHLPNAIDEEKDVYSADEVICVKRHIAIAKSVADLIPQVPEQVSAILLECRERADGFGYPHGKTAEKLGVEGQVLAMARGIVSVYGRLVLHNSYSWNSVVDVIRVPNSAHSNELRNASLRYLLKIKVPRNVIYTPKQIPFVIEEIKQKHRRLNEWFEFMHQLLELHKVELKENNEFKPFTLLYSLENTMVTSGLLSEFQYAWLNALSVPLNDDDCIEVTEYELKIIEIEKQCLFVMSKLNEMKQEFSKRFDSSELTKHYFTELMEVLSPELA